MSEPRDPLQKLWRESQTSEPLQPRGEAQEWAPTRGSEIHRLWRSIKRDGWFKVALSPLALIACFINGWDMSWIGIILLTIALLGSGMGALQILVLPPPSISIHRGALIARLQEDLINWRRRRIGYATLLGSTPALWWQSYQLAYQLSTHSLDGLSGVVPWLFFLVGAPLLGFISTWFHLARIDHWLVGIETALATFDPDSATRLGRFRRRSRLRLLVVAILLLILLLAGVMLLVSR